MGDNNNQVKGRLEEIAKSGEKLLSDVDGKSLGEYDGQIAFWHDEYEGDLKLHEYLGLTLEEYVQLVTPGKDGLRQHE